jgi:hypothetical protein
VLSCSKQQFCPCRGFAHIDKVVQQIWSKNAEKRLFGTDNYRFFIRTIQRLLGNHQVRCMDMKGLKDFQLDKVWSPFMTTFLLTKRTRASLVHSADESPNPHQCSIHLLKNCLPKWSPGVVPGAEIR